VIEFFSKAIHTIMAIETGRTERQSMGSHGSQIHLTVTGIAGVRSERCDIAVVTIITGEWQMCLRQ
jgi:hypothetical protein